MNNIHPIADIPVARATLLDYFAAHAPRDIPDWFMSEPDAFAGPDLPRIPANATDEGKGILNAWMLDSSFDLPEEYAWFEAATRAHLEAKEKHHQDYLVDRYAQWPWAYAETMLLTREVYLPPLPPLNQAGQEVVRAGLSAAVDAIHAQLPDFDANSPPGVDLMHALAQFVFACRAQVAGNPPPHQRPSYDPSKH